MNRFVPAIFVGLALLTACHSPPAPQSAQSAATLNLPPPAALPPNSVGAASSDASGDDEIVATVRGDAITRKDLVPVLIEAYGLNVLLTMVQLDLVEQEAARLHIVITPDDVANERVITLNNLEKATQQMEGSGQPTTQPDTLTSAQEEQLLDQLLQQEHVSKAEFNIILKVNTYLRKIAEPKVNSQLTEEALRRQFNAMYGEKVVVHYIVCNNMSEVEQVRAALAKGESFEDAARQFSRDRRTGATGGELPPFTLADNRFPDEFKELAFNMKVGEVSDPVQIGRFIYIAKLIDRIPPAQARFEDYRDSVKKELYDNTVQAAMKAMRDKLATLALDSLHIRDPILAQQWADRLENKNGEIRDQNAIRQELDREHAPATMPGEAGGTDAAEPRATLPATRP